MIRELSIHARRTNDKARNVFIILFLGSFLVLMASTLISHYKGVVGLVGMGLLVSAVFIYTKYLSSNYFYEITFDSEGIALFVVNQLVGKRMTTLCCIALDEIIKVEFESIEERRSHKTPSSVKKYNYSPTLLSERTLRIYTSGKHECAEIIIEVTEEAGTLISEYASEARNIAKEREINDEY